MLAGGSLLWRAVASADITVDPLSDAGGSGFGADPLTVETSTDGGTTWLVPQPAATVGHRVRRGRDRSFGSAAHDAAGNVSRLDARRTSGRRPAPPPATRRWPGGSDRHRWFDGLASECWSAPPCRPPSSTDAVAAASPATSTATSADGGSTWSVARSDGSAASVADEGRDAGAGSAAVDAAGLTSDWVPARPCGSISTARPVGTVAQRPDRHRAARGMAAWHLGHRRSAVRLQPTAGGAGLDHYEYAHLDRRRHELDGRRPGRHRRRHRRGRHPGALPRRRRRGQRVRTGRQGVGPARPHRHRATPWSLGGSAGWLNAASSRDDRLRVDGHARAAASTITSTSTSTDGGDELVGRVGRRRRLDRPAEGETLVRFRARATARA